MASAFAQEKLERLLDNVWLRLFTLDDLFVGYGDHKEPKISGWDNPKLFHYTRDTLIIEFLQTQKLALRLRPENGILVADIDARRFTSSYEEARAWRKSQIQTFRALGTLVQFTANAGVHVFYRAKSEAAVRQALGPELASKIERVRGWEATSFVWLAPTRLKDTGNSYSPTGFPGSYFLLDDSVLEQLQSKIIRVL